MNRNLRIFVAIFFLICGLVGLVLCFENLSAQPASTSGATIFGAVALFGFFAGWLLVRKPRY